MPDELGRVTNGYQRWLAKQPLGANTRRTYLGRVRQYTAYLAACVNDYGNPLTDSHARDYAIRDFKSHLKKSIKAKPASVNLMLAALDSLYLFFWLGRSNVRREDLPQEAPRALEVGCCLHYLGLLGNVADYSGWGIKHDTPQALKDIAFFHAKSRRLLGSLDQLFGKTLSLVGWGTI